MEDLPIFHADHHPSAYCRRTTANHKYMKNFNHGHFPPGKWRKILSVMRLKLIILLCTAGSVTASPTFSQQKKLDVSYQKTSLVSVLGDLKAKSGYQFLFYKDVVPASATVTLTRKEATLTEVLDEILPQHGLAYAIRDNVVVISPAEPAAQQPQAVPVRVTGTVRDKDGKPLPGVTVFVKNAQARGMATGTDGKFTVPARNGEVLVFSFVGKKPLEVTYTGQKEVDVTLEDMVTDVDQVVVTGMFTRRLESETGSSVQVSGDRLREVGNQNVLRSLANLDPSFMIMESLEFGSDPNAMPTIQMRGQSSFPNLRGDYQGNPNQPLFILDGFEVEIEKVYDLDMNRVATVTILKDASAKAIYGSKAGNGVVVIQTIRPKTGKIRVSYSGSLDIEAPDLTSYNLMNAREKYEFEVSSGFYMGTGGVESSYGGQHMMDGYREAIWREVAGGVDTYWLSQPLHVGTGHKHSLSLDGGDERILYGIGLGYNDVAGVMKGSDRSTFSGNMTFAYNYKNFLFRNTLELTMNNADNSPYGSFSDYTKLNPYWRIHDQAGGLIPYWTIKNGTEKYYNPLYNASLNTKNTSDYTEVRNNFQAEWQVLSHLRVTGRFSFSTRNGGSDVFLPANHTMFASYPAGETNRKGRYTKAESESTLYQADLGISFNRTFGRHMFFTNATWNISSIRSASHTYIAEGFGNDDMADIAFGTQYMAGSHPAGSSNNQREAGVIGALNYSFDDRYLFDVTARTSGSSMFGGNGRWGLFWSLGLGWNIHKEAFLRDAQWLDRFKVRGSVGYTGSQNFDPYQAKATYRYTDYIYDGEYGGILMGLPNKNLLWQRVLDYNAGADIVLWKNSVAVKFDYFIGVTDDLLMDVALPPSVGFSTYKENLGKVENRGYDVSVALTPWRNARQRGWLTLTLSAMHNKNTIKEISSTFTHRNNEQNDAKNKPITEMTYELDALRLQYARPSTLYYEGQSMNAIWGVRSAGINPMTGEELFYDLEGNIVTAWSPLHQTVIGDTSPKLRGNINLSAGFKGFTISIACSYKYGGDKYNTTLVDKIEYTSALVNLDRRIFQTWTRVGQVAPYKKLDMSIQGLSKNVTRPTSRFVMEDNEIVLSSMNVGYDFQNLKALSKVGLERLRLSFYTNELVRFSAVEIERGTSYPFARTFSCSVQATF